MIPYRFLASVAPAILVALAIGAAPASARDSSLCPGGEPAAVEAGAAVAACDARGERTQGASSRKAPLRDSGAAKATVITEPVTRTRHFIYRLKRPEEPSGETIVLLHGSGGDEASLFRLAARVAPDATLLGVRGRVVQKGIKRWYARLSAVEFDQADIRKEARAFAAFLEATMAAEKLDLDRTVFIGYSNGANLIAAMTLFYPDLVHRAVLLRAMPVLHAVPAADLHGARFLTIAGKLDRIYAPFAPALEALLRNRGATVDARRVARGHLLGDEDIEVVGDWLAAANAVAGGAAPQ